MNGFEGGGKGVSHNIFWTKNNRNRKIYSAL